MTRPLKPNRKNCLHKMSCWIPRYHFDKIREISNRRNITMSKLIAFAIDRELEIDRPFDFDDSIPDEDILEYAYADEAQRIIEFLSTWRVGTGKDILLLCRHEMGIEDKETFMLAFKECLDKGMIEAFKPPIRDDRRPPPDDYYYYRVREENPTVKRKVDKRAKEIEKYLKLKKKYGDMV